MNNKDIEIFDSELDVVERINILNHLGFKDEDMYIISSEDSNISMLRGLTDIVIKEDNESLWERFRSFLKGEDTITEAFSRMGIDDEERDIYKNELDAGKYILYVNKEYGSFYQLNDDDEYNPIIETLATEPDTETDEFDDLDPLPEIVREDIGMVKNPTMEEFNEGSLKRSPLDEFRIK